MEPRRVVEVLQKGKSCGSGYLITSHHVLTARHVPQPEDVGTACVIHPLRDAGEHVAALAACEPRPAPVQATVAWVSRKYDLAVIEVTGDLPPGLAAEVISFGRVPTSGKPAKCLGSGFPEAAGVNQRTITGTLTWVEDARRFDIDVISAIPREWNKWGGFSGAGIFVDDLLVGVVCTVNESWNGGVLGATPVENLLGDEGFLDFLKRANLPPPASREAETVDYAEAIYDRAYGDKALQLDFEANVSIEGTLRFSPRNPLVPFVGRRNELAALDGFLTADRSQPFAWWLVTGSGGAGKTRLARELCLSAHLRGWRAGFLPKEFKADIAKLDAWVPQRPSLIVADYVMTRMSDIRTLAARLARRNDLLPVRLLLLERNADELFKRQFPGSDESDRAVIEPACYKKLRPKEALPALALGDLTDDQIWDLVKHCPWRIDEVHVPVTRAQFFTRFNELDTQHRPLVAMILADALVTSDCAGLEGLETELRELLCRDRDHLWPKELGVVDIPIGGADADVIIAFATMVDGLGLPELETMEKAWVKLKQIDRSKMLSACARAIGKPPEGSPPRLGRLEPDLIGEFFALETLRGDPDHFLEPPRWMPETAWRAGEGAMFDFVTKSRQNFPGHPAIQRIGITVQGLELSWLLAAFDVLSRANNLAEGFENARAWLLPDAGSDLGAALALGYLTVEATSLEEFVIHALVPIALLNALGELQKKYAGEPRLRYRWARGVRNLVFRHAARDPKGCLDLLDALAVLYQEYADEPALREQWTHGVWSFVRCCAAEQPENCLRLLDSFEMLHEAHADEPALRKLWAETVPIFVADRAAEDPENCLRLLDSLEMLHQVHADEPALRKQWAMGVRDFLGWSAAKGSKDCLRLLDSLETLHKEHADEPALRERWAYGVWSFVRDRATDPGDCLRLLKALVALCGAHADESTLREPCTNSVWLFINYRAAKDPIPKDCVGLLEALAALCAAHDYEPALRGQLADGVLSFVRDRAADDPKDCLDLLGALAALHQAHADQPSLRELWAGGVKNFILCRVERDPKDCLGLLEALGALHREHDTEPALRELWAVGVGSFVAYRAAEDPEDCLSLLEALGALCKAHDDEPKLRESWAYGVRSFVAHRAAEDPKGCLYLLEALAALREAHDDEPKLREHWAYGVGFFVTYRAAEDPKRCLSLLEALGALCEAHVELRAHYNEVSRILHKS